ncbi:MAG: SDR family oxidoreductase [Candidatus Villigracilaceae bacterium]
MHTPSLALVTGAAQRLGRIFALTLARNGYDLILHYHRSAEQALQTQAEAEALGVRVTLAPADLTDPAQIQTVFQRVDESGAALRVLVNSAAIMSPPADVRTFSLQEWDNTLALNLRAPFLLAQQAAQRMTAGGLIVNLSDVGARKTWTAFPAYTVSKAGLEALTRLLARALAPAIRVNAIAPGLALPGGQISAEAWKNLVARLPLQRPAHEREIAQTLEFLLKNEYITGHILTIDGGYALL